MDEKVILFYEEIENIVKQKCEINLVNTINIENRKYKKVFFLIINIINSYISQKIIPLNLKTELREYTFKKFKKTHYHRILFKYFNYIYFDKTANLQIKSHKDYLCYKKKILVFFADSIRTLQKINGALLTNIENNDISELVHKILFFITIFVSYFN